MRQCIDDLAVDIELQLSVGRIADPHRARRMISGEMIKRPLWFGGITVDVIKDPQLGTREPGRLQQPAYKRFSLLGASQPEKRAHRQRSIAQPAEAIIPI